MLSLFVSLLEYFNDLALAVAVVVNVENGVMNVEVFQKGYKKGKHIIRFAMVKTAN